MRTYLPISLALILAAAPAAAQVPGVYGGTSAAFGGGTMGPYSGSVAGGGSAAVGAGTMGPTVGSSPYGNYATGGAQIQVPTTQIPTTTSTAGTGVNASTYGSFNPNSSGTIASPFANQSAFQPQTYAAPPVSYTVPSLVPQINNPATNPAATTTPVDTFTTTPSSGFTLPVAGANSSGTITNSSGF